MELALQHILTDKTVRSSRIQVLRDFHSRALASQPRKGEQVVSLMFSIIKIFVLMGDDLVELSTKNETLKNTIGFYDDKRLEENTLRLLK